MILVVDHYDSFTYNLVQLIEGLGHATQVVKSDAEPARTLAARAPDAVILSPVRDDRKRRDASPSCSTCSTRRSPCSGVCLGHQAIGIEYGGTVERTAPVHGKASMVFHEGRGIFEGVPDPFEAGRYHSLVVERDDLPAELRLTAWTEDGLVMGTQHRELPRYGVQFHPESILTPEGPTLVRNFLSLTDLNVVGRRMGVGVGSRPAIGSSDRQGEEPRHGAGAIRLRARDGTAGPEGARDPRATSGRAPPPAPNGRFATW